MYLKSSPSAVECHSAAIPSSSTPSSYPQSPGCTVVSTAPVGHILITAAGHQVTAEGVFTYKADNDGKLLALRAYWEVDQATASARKI